MGVFILLMTFLMMGKEMSQNKSILSFLVKALKYWD